VGVQAAAVREQCGARTQAPAVGGAKKKKNKREKYKTAKNCGQAR